MSLLHILYVTEKPGCLLKDINLFILEEPIRIVIRDILFSGGELNRGVDWGFRLYCGLK